METALICERCFEINYVIGHDSCCRKCNGKISFNAEVLPFRLGSCVPGSVFGNSKLILPVKSRVKPSLPTTSSHASTLILFVSNFVQNSSSYLYQNIHTRIVRWVAS